MESPHCLLQVNEQYSLCPLLPEMKHCHSMNISVENWGRGGILGWGFLVVSLDSLWQTIVLYALQFLYFVICEECHNITLQVELQAGIL